MAATDLKTDVEPLFELSESELELELGRRLLQTANEVDKQEELTAAHPGALTVDQSQLQALPDFTRQVALRFLSKFNRQMYSLVCDPTDEDNKKIRNAATQGAETLGYVLSGAFIATFGLLPGIATVLAVIIAKRVARSTHEALCESWKEQL